MFEVMCFGDSNTWGYDPVTRARHPGDVRWTGVLQASLGEGYRVIEEGLNSRTTVWEDDLEGDRMGKRHLVVCLDSQAPLDLVVIMLGTNDLKARFSAPPYDIAAGAGVLLDIVARSTAGRNGAAPRALLLSPPPVTKLTEFADMFAGSVEKSRALAPLYEAAARLRGAAFLDAGTVIRSSDLDGIHFEAAEHRKLGAAVAREVRKVLPV
jgi:lysophospholipase L1-like esterase